MAYGTLMVGLKVVLGLCLTGAHAMLTRQEGPKIIGYDCTRPKSSRIYQARGSCTVLDLGAGQMKDARIYQYVPEMRPSGWSCQVVVTSHVRYCGFASYTQTLPVGVTEEPC